LWKTDLVGTKKKLKFSLSQKGVELIVSFEGFSNKPYRDSGGVWTIGYGNTYIKNTKVHATTASISKEQGLTLLKETIRETEILMRRIIKGELNQNRWDSLVSLTYNIGIGNFKKSSVLKYLNDNNFIKASNAFMLWDKSGGKVLTGLVNRRKKEKNVFLL